MSHRSLIGGWALGRRSRVRSRNAGPLCDRSAHWKLILMTALPIGKLPHDLLAALLQRHGCDDPRIVVGPGIGQDAAVIGVGDRCLVAKSDPITFATDEIGRYAVHVNANDIACCGARPRWFLATLLLPESPQNARLAEDIFAQIADACRSLDIALAGGHTEITAGLERPIVVGHMLGEVDRQRFVTSAGARVGDVLILTKGIAIEGTAIIAREKPAALRDTSLEDVLTRAAGWLHDPGISVVRDAMLACETGGVHALHDPTEGGLATGLFELAEASQVGLEIEAAAIPVLPECRLLCERLGLDPLGLIASGALLIAADSDAAGTICERLQSSGIAAVRIGRVVERERGLTLLEADGTRRPLPDFSRDEIARLFE